MRGGMPMGMMGAGPRGMRGGGRGRGGGYPNNRRDGEFKPDRLEFEPDGEDAPENPGKAGNDKQEEKSADQNGGVEGGEAVPPIPDASNGEEGAGGVVREEKGGEEGAVDDGSASDPASKNVHSGQVSSSES